MAIRYKTIGAKIRERRKALGLTQERIAEYIGVSDIHYGRIERGDRAVSLELLERIAETLDVQVTELLTGAFPDLTAKQTTEPDEFVRSVQEMMTGMTEKERRLIFDFCYLIMADF